MVKRKNKTEVNGLKQVRLGDSYISLVLGAVVVIVAVILIFSFGKHRRIQETSSTKDGPVIQKENKRETSSLNQKIYTVKPNDDLWHIAENIYKDSYKWIDIAKANNLENPSTIFTGDKLILPEIKDVTLTPVPTNAIVPTQAPNPTSVVETVAGSKISITGEKYTVVSEDTLWDIAVRAYGDGFKWLDIAKANNLENPSLIFSENILKIPR